MRKALRNSLLLAFAMVCLFSLAFAQSKENGAIEGKVTTEGEPLPGVSVILTSPNVMGGSQIVGTNENGRFRFVALPPGVYALEAKLEGFTTSRKEGVRLSTGMTLTLDFAMSVGRIEEKIVVKGVLPLVDVKDSQTAVTTLSKEIIQNIPNNQFVSQVVNLAPGVTYDSAFGAADNGVQYQIDGVDTSDPELHTAYVFMDYGAIEEAKIMGIGAPAEYDGFSGIVFNVTTKSGSNKLEGMFDSFLQPAAWNSDNTGDLGWKPQFNALSNVHFSLGGPFIKDKLWFFFALQYYRSSVQIAGFEGGPTVYNQPRSFFKLAWQPNRDNRFGAFIEADIYNGENRAAGRYMAEEAVRNQRSPELAFNVNFLHIFSDHTFLEAKVAGYTSYYKLIPAQGYDVPGHYDLGTYMNTVNFPTYYDAYRDRYQANVSVSHHADNFIKGSHDFKFGIDAEMNPTHTRWGFSGGMYYLDYYYEPFIAYGYEGYDFHATNVRVSAFAQDSWSLTDRIKINPGLRFNYYRGSIKGEGTVFKPQPNIAPRIGITIDPFGDHRTALKFHYGMYYDNIITSYYTRLAPKPDYVMYEWDGAEYVEQWRDVWQNMYTFDPDIKLPHMNQLTFGIERELFSDLSVSLNYIRRDNKNFIERVNLTGEFEPVTIDYPGYGTYTVYNQLNPGEDTYIITNPHAGDYPIVAFTPTRKYTGIEFVLNKRWSKKWQVLASWVYGKATGTNDNDVWGERSSALGASGLFSDPNYQINAEGRLTYDPTHMIKIQGSVQLPLDILLSANFFYISGMTYSQFLQADLNQGYMSFLADPLGSYRLPDRKQLDLRVEKTFNIGKYRLGVMADCFNIFNAGTVTYVIQDAGADFGAPSTIVNPRVFRVGLRFYI